MKSTLHVTDNHFTLTGFKDMNDFTIGMVSDRIVIFPKLLSPAPLRFLFPNRDANSPYVAEAVLFIRNFYQLQEKTFDLEFIESPATGNYSCTTIKK